MDQLVPVCGFLCLYPLIVGALPTYLWFKYGRRVRIVLADETEDLKAKKSPQPTAGYARRQTLQ
jgi:hypothetical protein